MAGDRQYRLIFAKMVALVGDGELPANDLLCPRLAARFCGRMLGLGASVCGDVKCEWEGDHEASLLPVLFPHLAKEQPLPRLFALRLRTCSTE